MNKSSSYDINNEPSSSRRTVGRYPNFGLFSTSTLPKITLKPFNKIVEKVTSSEDVCRYDVYRYLQRKLESEREAEGFVSSSTDQNLINPSTPTIRTLMPSCGNIAVNKTAIESPFTDPILVGKLMPADQA
jgi:hypothetical protein